MGEQFADFSSASQLRFEGYAPTFEELMLDIRNEYLAFCHYHPRLSPERLREIDHVWRCAGCGPCNQAAAESRQDRTFCFDPVAKQAMTNDENTVQHIHSEQEWQAEHRRSDQRIAA